MPERLPPEAPPEAADGPRLISDVAAAEAWAALEDGFARASAAGPGQLHVSWFRLAGGQVHARVAGRDLAQQVGQAFAHLRIAEPPHGGAELALDLWDGKATGISLPRGTILDSIPGWYEGGGISTISSDSRYYIHGLFDSRAMIDRKARRLLCWTASGERLSLYERGKPFRVLLSVWLHDRGVQVVHAALVSSEGRGVLLPGRGGAGKSTSALACLLSGFEYLGDDYIGLERHAGGAFLGHSLYDSTWLEPDQLLRFPSLVPHVTEGGLSSERKRLVHLSRVLPERLGRSVPIRLLVLPRVTQTSTTEARPASRAETVLAMAPTSVFELAPRVGASGFRRLAALAAEVPAYWLELGGDLRSIPGCIHDLLRRASA